MIAPYAWVTGGEIPSQRLRSHTFGLAAAVGFLGAWVTTFTAPYFINPQSLNWGPRYGYIWLPSCIVATVWVYFCLPEVFGRTLEEIDEMVRAPETAYPRTTPIVDGVCRGWLTEIPVYPVCCRNTREKVQRIPMRGNSPDCQGRGCRGRRKGVAAAHSRGGPLPTIAPIERTVA